jgi:beta-lactamase class A
MSSLYHRRRRSSLRQLQVFGVLGVIIYVMAQFVVFQLSLTRVPDTWTIGGAAYPNESIEIAVEHVRADLQPPLALHYLDQTIQLDPASIDFSVDVTETLRLVREARSQSSALGDFLRHLILQPPAPRDMPVVANYSDERVRAQLAAAAAQYDQVPRPSQPVTATMTLQGAQPGHLLNIVQSMPAIDAALKSVTHRDVTLIVDELPAPAPTLELLAQLFEGRLASFQGRAGVFMKDLRTGEEINLNAGAAFSGAGLLKLPIAMEAFRRSAAELDEATTRLIAAALQTEQSNQPANALLAALGNGDAAAGASNVTALAHTLGLRDTFMALPYDAPITATQAISISTPANSGGIDTGADRAMQTTPADMGLLLEMIAQCRDSGGVLLAVMPAQFSSEKCQALMAALRNYAPTDVPALLLSGLPAEAEAVHRPGGTATMRADAAWVNSPGGDYVLVVCLSALDQPLDWTAANVVMADLSKAAYNYYNP